MSLSLPKANLPGLDNCCGGDRLSITIRGTVIGNTETTIEIDVDSFNLDKDKMKRHPAEVMRSINNLATDFRP